MLLVISALAQNAPANVAPKHAKMTSAVAAVAQAASAPGFGRANLPNAARDAMNAGLLRMDQQNRLQVYVELFTFGTPELNQIKATGAIVETTDARHMVVQALAPPSALSSLSALPFVRMVRLPDYAVFNTGSVTSQGDTVLHAADVRSTYGVNGRGIRIGVISDGLFGVFATGCTTCGPTTATPSPINSGDLPNATGTRNASGVLTAVSGGIVAQSFRADGNLEAGFSSSTGAEGDAMLEVIYDLAPGAQLYFANFSTSVEFQNAVNWMAANTDVMMTDVAFFGVPYDGTSTPSATMAAALNSGANPVRAIFNSVGNQAQGHWEESWLDSGVDGAASVGSAGHLQKFQATTQTNDLLNLGGTAYDIIQLNAGQTIFIYLVWGDTWGASSNDYDLYLVRKSTQAVVASSRNAQSGTQNPVETITYTNNTGAADQFEIILQNVNNAAQPVKFDMFVLGPKLPNSTQTHNYNTVAGSVPAASDAGGTPANVMSLGAMCYNCTAIEGYSSNGPTFDGRTKPDAIGVDGVAITGAGGFTDNPFYGTSAAAPHAGGIAALLMQLSPCMAAGSAGALAASTARVNLENVLLGNATDMGVGGADNVYGFGLLNALKSAQGLIPTANAGQNQSVSTSGTSASVVLNGTASSDPQGCPLTYSWSGTCGTATGASPTVSCPVGTDTMTLTVSNNAVTLSAPSTVTISVNQPTVTATPTFSPAGGTFTSPQSVTISDATSGAAIFYTTDGSVPTTSSTPYIGAVTVSASETIKAIAVASGLQQSPVAMATYTISVAPLINYTSFTSSTGLQLNNGAGVFSSQLWLAGGGNYQRRSAYYTTQVPVNAFTTDFDFQFTNAVGDGLTFTIQNSSLTALGGYNGAIGYGASGSFTAIPASVAVKFDIFNNAGEGTNSTGLYLNGASPTVPATTITGVILSSGDVLHAHIAYDGTTLALTLTDKTNTAIAPFTTSWPVNIPAAVGGNNAWVGFTASTGSTYVATEAVLNWTYSGGGGGSTQTAATPTFSPVAGTYTSAQSVTISDTTAGAAIFYTTDGSTPTTASTPFTGTPISVSATTTIKAIATASGFQQSAVGSATYTISAPVAATPTFSPTAGTYTSAQSVTLSDTTAGAAIFYTTDGSTPTTTSTPFTGTPISVGTTTTIKAIATASGFQQSAVGSATYTISAPVAATPTFSPAAGTYTSAQSVTISDTTAGAAIFYTTDGSTPTTASTPFTGTPIVIGATTTIKAIAVATGFQQSSVGSATYTISSTVTTYISFSKFSSSKSLTLNNGAGIFSQKLWIAGGGTFQRRSAYFNTKVPVNGFTTDFDFQLTSAVGDGFTFTIQNSSLTALGGYNGAIGYGASGSFTAIPASVTVKFDIFNNAGEGTNSTGLYLNGASPTVPATTITGVNLSSGDVLHAHITYDGTTLALTLTDKTNTAIPPFTTSWPVNVPGAVGGSTAWVGFTASTGGTYVATEAILNWTYTVP